MPDDKKKKDQAAEAEVEQAPAEATPQSEGTAGGVTAAESATEVSAASTTPQLTPLTPQQTERFRRRLKAKYH